MEEMNWGAVVRALLAQEQRTAGYLARQEIERLLSPIRNDATRLEPFGFKVYSQADEDGILEEIFSRLGITAGTFCEIGVENGLECNSLWLLHKGWRGAWIEGNPNQQAPITKTFCRLIEEQTLKVGIGLSPETISIAYWKDWGSIPMLSTFCPSISTGMISTFLNPWISFPKSFV